MGDGAEEVVVLLVEAPEDVDVTVLDVVDVELEVLVTATNCDLVSSQTANGSGSDGSSSNRSIPLSQQLAAPPSQQNDVSLPVALAQGIRLGPIPWSMLGPDRLANTNHARRPRVSRTS